MIVSLVLVLAQGLGPRVAAAPDGAVRFAFTARAGVCGNGRYVNDGDPDCACEAGPVRVALTVRGGAVQTLRTAVGALGSRRSGRRRNRPRCRPGP